MTVEGLGAAFPLGSIGVAFTGPATCLCPVTRSRHRGHWNTMSDCSIPFSFQRPRERGPADEAQVSIFDIWSPNQAAVMVFGYWSYHILLKKLPCLSIPDLLRFGLVRINEWLLQPLSVSFLLKLLHTHSSFSVMIFITCSFYVI